jgi:hypothetical protein
MGIQFGKLIEDAFKWLLSLLVALILVFVGAILSIVAATDIRKVSGRPGYGEMITASVILWSILGLVVFMSPFAVMSGGLIGIVIIGLMGVGILIATILMFVAVSKVAVSDDFKLKLKNATKAFGFSLATGILLLLTMAFLIFMFFYEIHSLRKHGAGKLIKTSAELALMAA